MKLLALLLLPTACVAMQNINIDIQANSNTNINIQVNVDSTLEAETKKLTHNEKPTRRDLITFLKTRNPYLFDENNYNIKFRATFRGSSFEVFAKDEIEQVILKDMKK